MSTADVHSFTQVARDLGVRIETIGDLVRSLRIPTYKVPGLIAAKGIDPDGRARIRKALGLSTARAAS